jgi:hypothetical protein
MSLKPFYLAGILFPFPLVFGGLIPPATGVASLEEGTVVSGRDFLVWEGTPGVLRASEVGCDRFYRPVSSPDLRAVAVWAGSDEVNCVLVVTGSGYEVSGPYTQAGLPCWDGAGNLWFTAEGMLLCNGEEVGPALPAHHISVDYAGGIVVFTDQGDRILSMNIGTGTVDTVSTAHRFYGPFFTPAGEIVSPSLDGGIWMFRGSEALFIDNGEHPAWWPEREGIVYIRSTDDGMNLTSSDIWFWTADAGSRQLTDTPYILEINPAPTPEGVYYLDAFSGLVGCFEALR